MQKILISAIYWTIGMFTFLAIFVAPTKGFGGIIASIFFLVSSLIFLPPTYSWLKPEIVSIYRKEISHSALIYLATTLMIIGILITPADQPKQEQAFANENGTEIVQQQTIESQLENNKEPLVHQILKNVADLVSNL